MDYPKFLVTNQKEESISIQRVKYIELCSMIRVSADLGSSENLCYAKESKSQTYFSPQIGLFLRCHMLFYLNSANLMIKENSENFMQMREL